MCLVRIDPRMNALTGPGMGELAREALTKRAGQHPHEP